MVKAEKAKVLQAYRSRSYYFTLAEPAPIPAPSTYFSFSANIESSNPISSCPTTSRPACRLANPTLQEDGFDLVKQRKKRSRAISPIREPFQLEVQIPSRIFKDIPAIATPATTITAEPTVVKEAPDITLTDV